MNYKDFLTLIRYLTLNSDGLSFEIEMVKPVSEIRKNIYFLTGNNLESINKKYDELSIDEYFNIVKINRLALCNIISIDTSLKLEKLYYTYLDNEYNKEKIILDEYRKMDSNYRKMLPDFYSVLNNFKLVKELKENKRLHLIDNKQKCILSLLSLFSIPLKIHSKENLVSLFLDDLSASDSINEKLFNLNYELFIHYQLKDVESIRDKQKTLHISMTSNFKEDIKELL